MDFLWNSAVIGIGGTIAMDLWALLLAAVFGLPKPNWGLVGRWFAHLAKGTFFHKDITAAQAIPNELALGWFSHYVIGILYAAALIIFAGREWVSNPTFLPAWIVGLVPLGAGWAASLRPNPMQIRALNLVSHTVFAAGMFTTALLFSRV